MVARDFDQAVNELTEAIELNPSALSRHRLLFATGAPRTGQPTPG
jgi:hypothetical protein